MVDCYKYYKIYKITNPSYFLSTLYNNNNNNNNEKTTKTTITINITTSNSNKNSSCW